ncbi:protein phosphatase [Rhizomicrobium palustre]|uniref:Protein phosphatase n=1 Tax=Rhizomicrobium palustre TaxID=189966 RepID=A0A846N1J9_9PROT|nr:PP2C family serine/threonine-protein phosphatase [Rhizomicrobium palustre]NIK89616.1 protein phosphatase [Rhizomicrobium palustre]
MTNAKTNITTEATASQWIGRRQQQEDSLLLRATKRSAAIFLSDGMGGHRGGAIASKIICAELCKHLRRAEAWDKTAMRRAIDAAHTALSIKAAHTGLRDMGGTALAVRTDGQSLYWVSIGDSPLYLIHRGQLTRLNADHSCAPILDEMVRRGEMSEAAANADSRRSALRSVVSVQPIGLVDYGCRPALLEPGDIVIAASDGIATLEEDVVIQEAMASTTASHLCTDLLKGVKARNLPDQDNVSLGVIYVKRVRLWFG